MDSTDKPLVMFGTGSYSDRMSYHFETDSDQKIAAYTVDRQFLKSDKHRGLPCLALDELADRFPPGEFSFFAAVGYAEQNEYRKRVVAAALGLGYDLANYISPTSQIEDVELPGNCVLHKNSIAGYGSVIGIGVVLGADSILSHHVTVEPFCYFSAGATVSGMVTIGERVFCGTRSVLIDSINIAAGTQIGAGSVVTKSISQPGVYAGNPARLLRNGTDSVKSG